MSRPQGTFAGRCLVTGRGGPMIARRPNPSSRPLAAARRMHLDSRLRCETAPGCGGRRPPARLDPHHPAPFSPPSPPAPRAWVRQMGAATGSARCDRATRRAPLAWTRTGGASAPARSLSSTSPPCRKAAPALESAPAPVALRRRTAPRPAAAAVLVVQVRARQELFIRRRCASRAGICEGAVPRGGARVRSHDRRSRWHRGRPKPVGRRLGDPAPLSSPRIFKVGSS